MAKSAAQIVVELIDNASGPAKKIATALREIQSSKSTANTKRLDAAQRDLAKSSAGATARFGPQAYGVTAVSSAMKAATLPAKKLAESNRALAKSIAPVTARFGPQAYGVVRVGKAMEAASAPARRLSAINRDLSKTAHTATRAMERQGRANRDLVGGMGQSGRAQLDRVTANRRLVDGMGAPSRNARRMAREESERFRAERRDRLARRSRTGFRGYLDDQEDAPAAGRRPRRKRERSLGPLGGAIGAIGAAGAYKEAAAFDRRLTMIGQTADASRAEIDAMGGSIFKLAQETAVPVGKVTGGLEALVAQGRSLKEGLEFLPSVARTAAASGSEVEDIAKTADSVGSNFNIAGKQMQSAFDIMVAGGKAGQFELKDMSRYIPSLAPAAKAVGVQSEKGLADIVSMLQIIRKGSGSSEEAASSLTNIFQKLESETTTKNFKKMGVDLEEAMKKGRKEGTNLIEVFEDAAQKATKGDLSLLPKLIQDQEFARGVRALLTYKGEWQKMSATIQATSAGSVMRDIVQPTQDAQASVDKLDNSWKRFTQGAAKAADSLGASSGLGKLGEEAETVASAMERINKAYKEGGISGALGEAGNIVGERRLENKKAFLDQDREASVTRVKDLEEQIAKTRENLGKKGYSKERIDSAVRSQEANLADARRAVGDVTQNRAELEQQIKRPASMLADPSAPIQGQPGAVGSGVKSFQEAYPLDISGRKPLPAATPLPPSRPADLARTIDRIEDVLSPGGPKGSGTFSGKSTPLPPQRPAGLGGGASVALPEISVDVDTKGIDQAKEKLKELEATPIVPKADGSGLAPLGTAADEAKGKLSELGGVTVSPTVNASSIREAEAAVTSLLSKLAQVGPAAAGAASAVGRAAAASGASAARVSLDRSKQTSQTSSPT